MKVLLTYRSDPGVFVVQTCSPAGEPLATTETSDLAVTLREVHQQLIRLRHLARGKTFAVKQGRSDA